MPSPLGHVLGGTAVYLAATNSESRSRLTLAVTLLGSIVPDFDFVPGVIIGEPAAFHHGISHSLPFAIFFAALVFLIVCRFENMKTAVPTGIVAGLVYASHLILDLVSVSEGRGIPIIWPITTDRFGVNLQLLGHFQHGRLAQGIWSVVRWENLPALTRELTVLGIPLLLLFWREKRARSTVLSRR
jgi:membrane-bound metal-dependent hydrolase YbcI (DUF457 family)